MHIQNRILFYMQKIDYPIVLTVRWRQWRTRLTVRCSMVRSLDHFADNFI